MTIWKKLGTLIRASATEPAEKLVDANAVRILQQELRETEYAMSQAKGELASLMAERKQLLRSNEALKATLDTRNQQARQALQQNNEALARELAQRIAEEEATLQEQQTAADSLATQEKQLRLRLREAAQTLQRYRRDMTLIRANRNAERLIGKLGAHTSGLSNHLGDLAESVAALKQQQCRFFDRDEALRDLEAESSGQDLDDRLRAAGIKTAQPDTDGVLSRLRAQISEDGAAASQP
ncbi:PspA/IM30 family protein [Marinobacteraceae bacterium S3BR75-40.1]